MDCKKYKKTNICQKVITIGAWGIFLISLMRMCISYNSLPDEIGVHFASDGTFDVVADKKFALYPYVVSFIALFFCELSTLAVGKIRTGLKISHKGEIQLKTVIGLFLNIFKICVVVLFSVMWADSVIRQQAMNEDVLTVISYIYVIVLVSFFIAAIVIRVKNPYVEENKE